MKPIKSVSWQILSMIVITLCAFTILIYSSENLLETENPKNAVLQETYNSSLNQTANVALTVTSASQPYGSSEEIIHWQENLPSSLRGTEVDGELREDSHGQLIISPDIRKLFDYFLTAQGEEPLELIAQRVNHYLQENLGTPAYLKAKQLFIAYLSILQERTELPSSNTASELTDLDIEAIAAQKAQLQFINEKFLSTEEIDAFFGAEEELDTYTFSRIAIARDASMSNEQKVAALESLELTMHSNKMNTLNNSRKIEEINAVSDLYSEGKISSNERYNRRVSAVGIEAAERLSALDRKREKWNQRIEDWMKLRHQIRSSNSWDEMTTQNEIDLLRNRYFNSQEVTRVLSLELATQ